MKQLFTLLLLVHLTQDASAQTTRFGLQSGTHLSIINSGSGYSLNDGQLFSYSAGVLMDLPLFHKIIFQPELNWIHKGGSNTFFVNERYALDYVELPLKILFRARSHDGFFMGGGPNLSYGVAGTLSTWDQTTPINFSGSWNDYRTPWELSLHLVTGYLTSSGWQFSLAFATSSIRSRISPSSPYENTYLGLRLAYLFSVKKSPHK